MCLLLLFNGLIRNNTKQKKKTTNKFTECVLVMMFLLQGQEEIRLIARSIKHHFPELFDDVYSPITYNFQHTDSDASRSSFNAFVDELFGHNAHLKIDAEPTEESEKLLEVSEQKKIG